MVNIRTKTIQTNVVPLLYHFYAPVSVCGVAYGEVRYPQYFSSSGQEATGKSSKRRRVSLDVFCSDKAKRVLGGLVEKGILDEDYQPQNLSWSKKGMLAQQLALKLGIENLWVTFAEFWHVSAVALRSGYNRALTQPRMSAFIESLGL